MKIAKNKIAAIMIAMFFILSMTGSLLLPATNAHTPPLIIPTWTFVSVAPQTVGVGQSVMIIMWQDLIPPTANGYYGDRWTLTVNVIKPDGTNDTLGPFTSDPVGGTFTNYTPTELGNYTFQASTLQHILSNQPNGINPVAGIVQSNSFTGNVSDYLGDIFLPSTSKPVQLVVQQTPIPSYQETPIPAAYWSRPIYGTNHLWFTLAGQWLGGGDSNPGARANLYTEGPTTSHIDWTVPFGTGGLTGGGSSYTFYATNEYSGQSYQTITGPSIIEDGMLYYTVSTPPRDGWYALNLQTGQEVYFVNTTGAVIWGGSHDTGSIPYGAPAFGQVFDYESPNQHGTFDYLWVTNTGVTGKWNMLDAYTGNYILSLANVTQSARTAAKTTVTTGATGTSQTDSIGSICYYNIVNLGNATNPNTYLQIWNTTQAIMALSFDLTASNSNAYLEYRPVLNYTFDGNRGFSLNASIPAVQGSIRQVITEKYVIGGTTGNVTANPGQNTPGNLWALNLDPNNGKPLGSLLWNITFAPPTGYPDSSIMKIVNTGDDHDPSWGGLDQQSGIFYFTDTIAMTYSVYSLATGNLLWTSAPLPQWSYYGMSTSILSGVLYSYGYSGVLTAFNATTGNILWQWTAPSVGINETPYPQTPLSWACATTGNGQTLIYMYSSEHSVNAPIRRDASIWCINATDGRMLWQLNGWPCTAPIVADGRLVYANCQDMQIYCFGPGLSKTTVSAPQIASSGGTKVEIVGTVTDDTPSGKDQGTPAINDASMDAWMAYLYQQQPFPKDATGVPVSIDAIDPNGNLIHIGETTSDYTGTYGCAWTTPNIPGEYKIIASFAGSQAYDSSFAQTYMSISEVAPTASPYPVAVLPPTEMYIVAGVAAMVIAIAIVGAVLFMAIRKRP